MNFIRFSAPVLLALCLRAAAAPYLECVDLEGMLELPPGVKGIAAHGFEPVAGGRLGQEDALSAERYLPGGAAVVLEVEGPRTVRFYHDSSAGGTVTLWMDGKHLQSYDGDYLPLITEVTVPAGAHHLQVQSRQASLRIYRVTSPTPGLPVLTQPDVVLPLDAPVALRLPVESGTPVTWSATGLPDGLTLDAATGRLTGWISGPAVSDTPAAVWVTMTNAQGAQSELVRIWWMEDTTMNNGLPVAGRHARREFARPFLTGVPGNLTASPPVDRHLTLAAALSEGLPAGDVVATVTGPTTLHFRSRGSRESAGPVVVRVDGAEVLRRVALATMDEEMSVEIPPGQHEVVWQFPPGGRLDRIVRGSDPIPQTLGPRLLGPFLLTARPGVPFSFDLEAASPFGPGRFFGTPPADVVLDQESGMLTGTLAAGDHWISTTIWQSDESDSAVYQLQVREDAAAVLNTPGLTWLQSAGPQAWHSAPAGPGGGVVWEFSQTAAPRGEVSRMEAVIEGPDTLHLETVLLSPDAPVSVEVDGREYSTGWFLDERLTGPRYLNVPIPAGRHVVALKAAQRNPGTVHVQISRLLLASAGAPVLRLPDIISHDGGQPIYLELDAGGSGDFSVTGLPDTMWLAGNVIRGELSPDDHPFSTISVTRGGITTSGTVSWSINDINKPIGSTGWYGYGDEYTQVAPLGAYSAAWDGLSCLQILQEMDWSGRYGHHEAGIARTITGPDTLSFRRKTDRPVFLEVKVDGALVHHERVPAGAWGTVAVAIPSGGHHVSIAARPAAPDSPSGRAGVDFSQLLLDDLRLASELRPDITEATRRLEVLAGENVSFTLQSTGNVREWSLEGMPEGFSFDNKHGILSATPVTAVSAEYPVKFIAYNSHGTDAIQVVIAVGAVPARGDSPKLRLQKEGWFLQPEFTEPPLDPLDPGDVHYSRDNNLGIMSAWLEGPDTMRFRWQDTHGDTFFYVQIDGQKVYDPDFYVYGYWEHVEIPIPPGRHLVEWYGYDTVAVDDITLASDGVPQVLTRREYPVNAAGFSLHLAARNGPVTWACEEFAISPAGVITGNFEADETITVHVSATNAAGTGYAEFTLRAEDGFNRALDSPLVWSSPGNEWYAQVPDPGEQPTPADGEDFVYTNTTVPASLRVEFPPGGGLLALWVKAPGIYHSLAVSGAPQDDFYDAAMTFELPGDDGWYRLLIPLEAVGGTLYFSNYASDEAGPLCLDRAEILQPGDAMIDTCALPAPVSGQPYTAQLRLLTGGPVQWSVSGLPTGLTLDSATGVISGIPQTVPPARAELRVTATAADGRTTFAWMKLDFLQSVAEALDTHSLAWRLERVQPSTGWVPGLAPGIQVWDTHASHDGVDYVSCFVDYRGRAVLSTTVTGPGHLSFWWSVPAADNPRFYINGVFKASPDYGSTPGRYTVALPAGTHELQWVSTNTDGSEYGIGYIDRVLWSGDAAPLFTCETFDLEVEPGTPLAHTIPTNGAPVFRGENLPAWLALNAASGQLSGTVPADFTTASFTVIITQDGREDRAVFRIHGRPSAASALDTAEGVWARTADSHWRVSSDPAHLRPGGGTAFELTPGHYEPLQLFVDGPCFVSWWSSLGDSSDLRVRPRHLATAAVYYRRGPGGWLRGLVAVPGAGRQSVNFECYAGSGGSVLLDTVQTFPWNDDANTDGLANSMAVALGHWPDAPSGGDPLLTVEPLPNDPAQTLLSFGHPDPGSAFGPTRDHAMRLLPLQSADLTTWQPAQATVVPSGLFLRRWNVSSPPQDRIFRSVTAEPHPQ